MKMSWLIYWRISLLKSLKRQWKVMRKMKHLKKKCNQKLMKPMKVKRVNRMRATQHLFQMIKSKKRRRRNKKRPRRNSSSNRTWLLPLKNLGIS